MPADDVDLRSYIERLMDERAKHLDERWHTQQDALQKATEALDKRLDLLNELRIGILTREEYESKHQLVVVAISQNREYLDRIRGESLTIKNHKPFEDRLAALELWRSNVMGRAVAISVLGTVFVAAIVALLTHLK